MAGTAAATVLGPVLAGGRGAVRSARTPVPAPGDGEDGGPGGRCL